MRAIAIAILLIATQAHAWNTVKQPDATPAECKAQGKSFVKASVRKNGVHVRAFCRGAHVTK